MKKNIKSILSLILLLISYHCFAQSDWDKKSKVIIDSANLAQRHFIVSPSVSNRNRVTGKVIIDYTINKNGDVIDAHCNKKYTTVSDTSLLNGCENAVKRSKINSSQTAPDIQKAQLIFVFKVE